MPYRARRPVVTLPLLAILAACATGSDDGNDDAFITTSTTTPTTTQTVTTVDPVTTQPDVTTASEVESSGGDTSSGSGPDVPAECEPGAVDCPCDEGTCVETAMCVEDVCVAKVECEPDLNEPNEYDDEATPLGDISDDPAQTLELVGVLDGKDDVDWFSYHGTDVLGETVAPGRTLFIEDGGLELCKFFTCDEGQPQVVCPEGTVGATEGFMNGCCAASSFQFTDDGIECLAGAFNTGGTVYIRLRNATEQCVAYEGTVAFGQ